VATTGSDYQRGLIERFAAGVPVAEVACPGLADAIHAGDEIATEAAVAAAATQTPPGTSAVVLGCTEYELAAERIAAAVPGAVPFGSAAAVAAQALRRAAATAGGEGNAAHASGGETAPSSIGTATGRTGGRAAAATPIDAGRVYVLLSGRLGELPEAALRYPEGRLLAGLPVGEASYRPA
jgi:glutamate racemase